MRKLKVWQLVGLLLVVVFGAVLFVGLAAGWFFDKRAALSPEYFCGDECTGEYENLTIEKYEELIKDKKSFMVFVDQGGCTTADRLEGFASDLAKSRKIKIYKIMFEDMKKSSLHDKVKYYPSLVVISNGNPIGWLRADEDEDSDAYNRYDAFEIWVNKYLK